MTTRPGNLVVGIDLGGTNMQAAVVDMEWKIIGRHWTTTRPAEGLDAVVDRIVTGAATACDEAGVTMDDIIAVGIASPGAIDIPNGVVLESPNLDWVDVPLRTLLYERMNCDIVLENDVNAAVWAEQQMGAGRGHRDVLGVWLGTGVGGGLVLGGQIYHGPSFTAGEIGHTVLLPDERPGRRTVEDICSRSGMSNAIDRKLREFPKSLLHDRLDAKDELDIIDMRLLVEALKAEDPLVKRTVQRATKMLGIAIANWVTVLSLDRVVLGGGVTEAFGQSFVARVNASFRSNVFPEQLKSCSLVMTELAGDAGLLGAALLARGHG